jgi:hypothetical protein
MKQTALIVAALVAGFVGGILGTRMIRTLEQPHPEQVVRARSFELVDHAGETIAYWGVDKGQNAVLAFGSQRPTGPVGRDALARRPGLGLDNPHNQRAALGVIDDSPFVFFRAPDGKPRMSLSLSIYGKPILVMDDETGKRMSLGAEHSDTPGPGDNDWALDFGPDRARIGMFAREEGGQTYVRGMFSVSRDKVKYPYQQPK